ncbi:MAG: UbiA family prenyltransferase, partial [Fibrobacterota bacterium]
PLLPKNNLPLLRHRKLKDIVLSKDIGISLAWSVICVSLPWLQADWPAGLPAPGAFFTLGFIFVLVFNRSIYHDLHDIQRDLIVGRETLPILMGRKFRKFFPLVPLLLTAILPLAGVATGALPTRAALLTLCTAYLAGVHVLFKRNKLSDATRFDTVVDFSLLLPGILLWFASL